MKNRRVKTIRVFVFLLLMSIISMAYAHTEAEQRTQLPHDVQAFFANNRWKDWEVTGWVNPRQQKSKNACAFAAVKDGNANVLVAFGWIDGVW